jgi:methionyl-tRNA formyltransferase
MGTPKIASEYLQVLVQNNLNIISVYTQPPRPKGRGMSIQNSFVHDEALKQGIPVYHPDNFKDQKTLEKFIKLKPDLVVLMAYGNILPKKVIQCPKYGCINIHVSLLPLWRGAAPVEHALLNGDKTTGVTIFQLINKLDAGPIISQASTSIDETLNKEELFKKLNNMGKKLMIKTLPDYFNNKIILKKQNEEKATYASKITANMTKINFNENVTNVFNQIRAFSPKPGAWFLHQNERIKIISCSKLINNSTASTIINENFHIGCKGGSIAPIIIQREGKKPMGIKDFLRGFQFSVGQIVNV